MAAQALLWLKVLFLLSIVFVTNWLHWLVKELTEVVITGLMILQWLKGDLYMLVHTDEQPYTYMWYRVHYTEWTTGELWLWCEGNDFITYNTYVSPDLQIKYWKNSLKMSVFPSNISVDNHVIVHAACWNLSSSYRRSGLTTPTCARWLLPSNKERQLIGTKTRAIAQSAIFLWYVRTKRPIERNYCHYISCIARLTCFALGSKSESVVVLLHARDSRLIRKDNDRRLSFPFPPPFQAKLHKTWQVW